MTRLLFILGAAIALSACGARSPLVPVEGASLPPAPYGATEQPDSDHLLKQETLAAPERNVELRRRSEERGDDPFDLPPE